ncbi:D-2-hydroxyacid dehydrogenase [Caproiciproducens faecalis]|uniref:D-2-hydroxyacid dehydrogenase n=1 Tax=Caproiciproducens faecalis TaxID=2820301 RepID=A0ABS7DPT6_9FIRM|nr:D-2-hydroxyacid dehydrogenase [Caproiciproducens faecalis]MBW7573288.1 D-2-hydroxyacid dehydrogenase [Caproiciproducens faecalis]
MSFSKRVLVLLPAETRHKALLQQSAPECRFLYSTYRDVTREQVQDAQIIIGNPPADYVKNSPNLEWLHCHSAGVDSFLKEDVLPKGTALTNSTGAYGLAVSEHLLGMLLEIIKRLHTYRDAQKLHLWQGQGKVKSIYQSTVLVIGLGDIGGEFARKVKALGAYVIGLRRTCAEKPDYVDEIHLAADLDSLLPRADIVAICLPATKETNRLFSRERLALLKEGAVLLNASRGTLIDTEALCDALESGHLFGAGLDVTDPEPLPKDHRLWEIPSAVVTPHISGLYHLPETLERVVRIAAENLRLYANGEPLNNYVDFTTGYRKKK